MGNGIFADEAKIYIAAADTDGADLTDTELVTGEVSNFSESGGEEDIESIAVFGGGNMDKTNPRTQIEVSFDIEMQYDPDEGVSTKWDAFKYGAGLTSATSGTKKVIAIQWSDGTNYYSRAYNNCRAVTFNPASSADGNLKATITFKTSPTTTANVANQKVKALPLSDATFDW